jgi:hypothetical protein
MKLTPKRTPFQIGTNSPICERCLIKEASATHILCNCDAAAYLRLCRLGHCCMEPSDYHDAPIRKVVCFIKRVGLTEE